MIDIVLASSSFTRRSLLSVILTSFEVAEPDLDERALQDVAVGANAESIALLLAKAKAQHISRRYLNKAVIGADQTLGLDGEILCKPEHRNRAVRQITRMAGRTHVLYSAVAVARQGEIVESFVRSAHMSVRMLDEEAIQKYVSLAVEKNMLSSVGGYHFEGAGIGLFSSVSGDYSTILGLPLQETLNCLRRLGAIR